MGQTIYASFLDLDEAERAAGALIDHGVRAEDISFVANESAVDTDRSVLRLSDREVVYTDYRDVESIKDANEAEHAAKTGISTTTPADVKSGAVKGAGVGVGIGALAAVASLFIPGVGLVLGGGALATALVGAAATTAAGVAAGGVVGYLKDQGLPDETIAAYTETLVEGGAIIAIRTPSGEVDLARIATLLAKYGATNVNHFGSIPDTAEGAA